MFHCQELQGMSVDVVGPLKQLLLQMLTLKVEYVKYVFSWKKNKNVCNNDWHH